MRFGVPSIRRFPAKPLRRVFGSLLGIALLVLQLFAPEMARAALGGTWVEICSDYGVIEVQMDLGGTDSGTGSVCPECVFCALVNVATKESATQLVQFDSVFLLSGQYPSEVTVQNPAQFWHKNRAPPRQKSTIIRAGRDCLASIRGIGEVPCR